MKKVKFLSTIAVASCLLSLGSCNSGEDKKTEASSADTTTIKAETPAPVPPATSQFMTIIQKVANYDKWKPVYDSHDSVRQSNGLHNYVIARGTEDPNMVLVALKMDDVDKAKGMVASQEMKDRMKKAGVTGSPSFDYLVSIMNDTTAIQATTRLMVKHKVKDWDAWKKVFDEHKQARMNAGLTDRVVGYTIGDNHNVTLVFSVADMAKAKAFINSKDLKDKMNEAGVEGPPSFFFYRIVEKY
jgi:hypothetical protein